MVVGEVRRLRQQVTGAWTRYHSALIALSLTLLGAGLRLYDIGANSFNLDEAWAIWLAEHDASFIVQLTTWGGADAGTPPVYYVLLHASMLLGAQPLVVRLVSVLAGTLMVWLTFRLAAQLFDLHVATLSAFLIAVAPTHIAWSRVARAYMLGGLLALFSLYFFARLLFSEEERGDWLGLVIATAAAIWTHYLTVLLVLFENGLIAFLWLRRRLSRLLFIRWLVSQIVLGIVALPALLGALTAVPTTKDNWWTRPGLQALVKSAILFSTGDPSYGPMGVTSARILSLMTIVGLCVLGLRVFLQRGYHRRLDDEGRRVLFLISAFMIPWVTALTISQVRPTYAEKYFLFLMPPLFVLFAWIFTRARQVIISSLVLLALISLTGSALFVYYTEPFGEQWREATAYMRPAYQPDDLVVISPGWYGRPYAYYFYGGFPEDINALTYIPVIVVENGEFRAVSFLDRAGGVRASDPALASAQRIWLLSGYSLVDPRVMTWTEQNFEPIDIREFVGVRVDLLQRSQDPGTQATTIQE